MKKTLPLFLVFFSFYLLTTTSCQKTSSFVNPTAQDTSTAVASDNADATQATTDAENSSTSAISDKNSPAMQLSSPSRVLIQHDGTGSVALPILSLPTIILGLLGDTVSINTVGTVDTMRASFGLAGVVSPADGMLRKGAIKSHFAKKFYEIGFTDTITFDNYFINGKHVEGTIILTRLSDSSMSREIIGGLIIYPSGLKTSFTSKTTKVFNFAVEKGTTLPAAYKVKEFGSYTGTTRAGVAYTATVAASNPLVYDLSCMITGGSFPVQGSMDISSSFFKNDRIIDYGTGSCDHDFTVKVGTYTAKASFTGTAN